MQVYFVTQAANTDESVAYFPSLEMKNASSFIVKDEAIDFATELAQANPGKSFWVVPGEPSHSFRCEPLPVIDELSVLSNENLEALVADYG